MIATTAVVNEKNHYKWSTIWIVVGISIGAQSYAYAGSIIGTTLGKSVVAPVSTIFSFEKNPDY
jgi:hypothetical protein